MSIIYLSVIRIIWIIFLAVSESCVVQIYLCNVSGENDMKFDNICDISAGVVHHLNGLSAGAALVAATVGPFE